MKKKLLAYLLTSAMTLSFVSPAVSGAQKAETEASRMIAETETPRTEAETGASRTNTETQMTFSAPGGEEGTAGHVWEASTKMSLKRENTLRQEAGMSVQEWDDAVAAKRKEGKDAPLTKEGILAANPDAQILTKDGKVYYLSQTDAIGEVTNALDAYRAVSSLAALMGGNELADLRLWQQMDIDDMRIYSFQQISDSRMVLGSTIKIAVKDGKVSAVFSCLDPEAGKKETLVTQEKAQDEVLRTLKEAGEKAAILPEYTDRIRYTPTVLSDLNLDNMNDDPVPEELRWVVYSENQNDETYPFTAHYLDLAGKYLESLPVKEPGSDEALCAFRKQDVFGGMSADTWTGEIKGEEDEARVVTLPVMRDEEGRWYLGDVKRRIAVADFATAVYEDEHVLELVSSDDNADWDNEDLYMYYNYLNAWDFYADMGWNGPDGEGTDVIILKELCTSDGTPFENACSLGMVQGWEMFGYTAYTATGEPLSLGRGQDVMAHEYTHTFTATVMNSNLYENDQGAINEAMSDIMGNLVELILGETDDTRWLLGENTGTTVRNMLDPGAYQQPAYVWDEFYGPVTEVPTESNDRGGVHVKSSLLNLIAARLCMESGMKHEDAIRFWVLAAGGLTPKTDYTQLPAVLKWAITQSGNEDLKEELNSLIDEVQLGKTQIPEKLPLDRKIVHLALPDTGAFADENWTLMYVQLNTETIGNAAMTMFQLAGQLLKDGADAKEFGRILSDFLDRIHLDGTKIRLDESNDEEDVADAISLAVFSTLGRLLEQGLAWRTEEGGDITFVTDDDPTAYVLINLAQAGTKVNGLCVLIGESWIDLTPFLGLGEKLIETKDGEVSEQGLISDLLAELTPDQVGAMIETVLQIKEALSSDKKDRAKIEQPQAEIQDYAEALLEYLFADKDEKEKGLVMKARVQELPTEGLEKVRLITE